MAIYSGKNLKGSVGNVTLTKQGDVSIIKSKIENIKQTKATKRAAAIFGTYVSPFARLIRLSFGVLINSNADRAMVNRMNSDISTIIYQHVDAERNFNFSETSFDRLLDFNFNLLSPLNKSLLAKPTVTFTPGNAEILWPEFLIAKNLRFPAKATSCVVSFRCAQFCLNKGEWNVTELEEIEIKKDQVSTISQSFNFTMPIGSLFLAGIGITYFSGMLKINLNSKTFNPASIFAVSFVPGRCAAAEVEDWMTLPFTME